ncbi:dNTP triphosphohydrolase [Candidatus Peregrinibacteria bacterium]|jgi:dGTPase|nr:dNTP triphosphohydrolase [Candidatus Peregrinibacteria bacterium]MBT4056470.1 dNTP triphosphohydrolase [Candidatus Peregrinibacteria bacterium]
MVRDQSQLEELERARLAAYAMMSSDTRGRHHEERECGARLCFQKDKDRIVHCKAFRRLDEKTQVFPAFFGDHYRTRLTHTIEVAQISRDVCRRLGLNEDLAEAIALAHDLGHPPFGHSGEEALDEVLGEFGLRFEHNEQSQRVVEKLEKLYPEFDGLNLSFEVLEGLQKHQTIWDRSGEEVGEMHLEGQVVNLADEIAYTNHDMDDGLRSGILKEEDLEECRLWSEAVDVVRGRYGELEDDDVRRSRIISKVIAFMIGDICANFEESESEIRFGEEMIEKVRELRKVLFEKFYLSKEVKGKLEEGKTMIKQLFKYYMGNPEAVPEKYRRENCLEVGAKDYIAGMTDQFLRKEIEKIG